MDTRAIDLPDALEGVVRDIDLPDALEGVVRVGPSAVHGLGLFARVGIARNRLLGRYGGRLVRDDDERALSSDYVFSLGDSDWSVDGADCTAANWARYINHAPRARCNVIFTTSGCVRACRDIAPDEELLIDYGGEYWDQAGRAQKSEGHRSTP